MSTAKLLTIAKHKGLSLDPVLLKKAYQFAASAHAGQVRQTGEPYITHPLAVAAILLEWDQPQEVVIAALLHDTVEDSPNVTLPQLSAQFGPDIAFLVDGVTKVGNVRLRNSTDQAFVENLRKMFIAMAKDIRVVLIRLADRLHNMRTLDAIPLSRQKRIAKETIEVYAPLAERLGMGHVKGELEDLSFPYIAPKEYTQLLDLSATHYKKAKHLVDTLIREIKDRLSQTGIIAVVEGRSKHLYSLYKKLLRPEIDYDINKIHDLIALRIITKTKMDCYAALGIIHTYWKPVPHIGISDFIAQPKPNGYQSIHTKIFDRQLGRIVEVQIRTEKMHQQAELGAAAHYAYSEAKQTGVKQKVLDKGINADLDKKINWVKQLASWQHQVKSSEEFVTGLKLDALSSRIYVFSPKGDVYDLPSLATPVDLAFAVHTDLGFYIQAAKVNGKIVPLNYQLSSGDLVEIITSKHRRSPTRDWLRFVKTAKARTKIHHFFNELDK